MNQSIREAEQEEDRTTLVRLAASAVLPTAYGDMVITGFETSDGKEHVAIVKGDVSGCEGVPLRVHSECFTGDVMGSLKCDCRAQLEAALELVSKSERGVVLYLRQEGRGIGLVNKIRAYALQDQGLDTVEANHALGFPNDVRSYKIAAEMIGKLGIHSIQLMSNNPEKIEGLVESGVIITGRIPITTEPNPHNQRYLSTKKIKSGHLL